ncbi:eukaryotic translation initiation factor 4 gamma 2 isoform X2 [Neocloeon triangulifer]|nr:eukaryotic translation initiation factor 4 gamma 2 isoform X2 [Neocloeon triangulifer]
MYAQLCKRLSEEAPNFEPPNSACTFRLLLLGKCRDEFENRSKIAEAFENHDGVLSPEEDERLQLAKRKMLGNIKFIGELGKLEILHEAILHRCCQQLLEKKKHRLGSAKDTAEDLECLCQIMRTCGRILDSEKGKTLMNQYFDRMARLVENHELPLRIRFMLKDAIELRRNHWVPRKATNVEGPMPIQQIRSEENSSRGFNSGSMHSDGPGRHGNSDQRHMHEFFRSPLQTRVGMSDMLSHLPLGNGASNLQQDKFNSYNSNGYPSSGNFRNQRHSGFSGSNGGNQQNFYPNQNRQNFNNKQQQQQNFPNQGGNKEIAPRFMQKIMQGQVMHNPEEVSLRPAANSMLFKKNTNPPKPPMGMNSGRPIESLLPPGQAGQKSPPQMMQKESAILIKQASLDKNKASKKDKGPNKEELLKKIDTMMEEFLSSGNTTEAISFYREQKIPDRFVPEILLAMMVKSLDKGDVEREHLSNLMVSIRKEALITAVQYMDSIKELVKQMSEKEQEIPRIFSHVAGFAAHAISAEMVTLAEVAELTEHGAHYPLFMLLLQQLHKTQGKVPLGKLYEDSKVNLLQMLPEGDRTKERLAEILEDRDLSFLLPLLRIQSELWKQLQSDPNPTQFYKWIKENLDPSHYTNPGFVNALVTVLIKYITQESTLAEGLDASNPPEKAVLEKEQALLGRFKLVLQSFLHEKVDLQVIAVYGLQTFCHSLQFPKGMLLRWFHNLYDLEVIEEEAFMKWKEDISDDYPGKGNALFQVNQWLTWLAEAEYEEEEDEEGDD